MEPTKVLHDPGHLFFSWSLHSEAGCDIAHDSLAKIGNFISDQDKILFEMHFLHIYEFIIHMCKIIFLPQPCIKTKHIGIVLLMLYQ